MKIDFFFKQSELAKKPLNTLHGVSDELSENFQIFPTNNFDMYANIL